MEICVGRSFYLPSKPEGKLLVQQMQKGKLMKVCTISCDQLRVMYLYHVTGIRPIWLPTRFSTWKPGRYIPSMLWDATKEQESMPPLLIMNDSLNRQLKIHCNLKLLRFDSNAASYGSWWAWGIFCYFHILCYCHTSNYENSKGNSWLHMSGLIWGYMMDLPPMCHHTKWPMVPMSQPLRSIFGNPPPASRTHLFGHQATSLTSIITIHQ